MNWKNTMAEVREIFLKYREEITGEILLIDNLMHILMKGMHAKWTDGELAVIKKNLKHLAKRIPILALLLAPGGMVMLPILTEILDRRNRNKTVFIDRRCQSTKDPVERGSIETKP